MELDSCATLRPRIWEKRESALDDFAPIAEQEKDHKMLQNVIMHFFFLQTVLSSNGHEYTTCKFLMIMGVVLTGSKRNHMMSCCLHFLDSNSDME